MKTTRNCAATDAQPPRTSLRQGIQTDGAVLGITCSTQATAIKIRGQGGVDEPCGGGPWTQSRGLLRKTPPRHLFRHAHSGSRRGPMRLQHPQQTKAFNLVAPTGGAGVRGLGDHTPTCTTTILPHGERTKHPTHQRRSSTAPPRSTSLVLLCLLLLPSLLCRRCLPRLPRCHRPPCPRLRSCSRSPFHPPLCVPFLKAQRERVVRAEFQWTST